MHVKEEREAVSLLYLPDELLLQVMDELDGSDLYVLSILCKRLQRLSLPLYLRGLGVATPLISTIDHLSITREQLFVPGISLAFFAKNVRRFSCDIGPIWPLADNTSALQRLRSMIINFEGMEDLALHFDDWYFTHLDRCDLAADACKLLLEDAAEHCTCLTLSHNGNCPEQWALHLAVLVEKDVTRWMNGPPLKRSLKAFWNRLPLGTSRSKPSQVPEAYTYHSYTVKTLTFRSDRFLLPPFSGWAIRILNAAPLTRLDLIEVRLSRPIASLISRVLTIPTLKHFRVIACEFRWYFDALAEFLSRHNNISTFEIIPLSWSAYRLPVTTLPALLSLKSNLSSIDCLLTPTGIFPKLIHICAVTHLAPNDQFMFNAVENSLTRAAKRLADTNIRLCLGVLPASHTAGNLANSGKLWSDLKDYCVLSRVRQIAFGFSLSDILPSSAIPTWLPMFPLLEHIEFLNTPIGLDYEVQMSFLRRVTRNCTGIRAVKIGDDTRDISAWLTSDR